MNALSPAKVQRVSITSEPDKVMEVVVEDSQLSLAIGKKGQNVRLAAKLTGWKIDIKSEEEKRREVEAELGALEAPAGDDTGADAEAGVEAESGAEVEPGVEAEAGVEAETGVDAETGADPESPAAGQADGADKAQ